MEKVQLTQGKFAIVDDEDFVYINRFKWFAACSEGSFHARRGLRAATQKGVIVDVYIGLETLLLPPKLYSVIAHKNKDTLDYRKENLFYESYSVKRHRADKQKGKTTSKYKGVCRWKYGKKKPWLACIYQRGEDGLKRRFVGYYATEKEAAIAYNEKALQLYGEHAYQNVIV